MTVTVKNIIPAKQAENAQTTQYTAVGGKTIIDKFTVTNTTAGAVNSHLAQMGKLPVSQEDEDRLAAFCGMAWTKEVVAAYKSIESAFAL